MRKGTPKKRQILPDPRYGEVVVAQFVNNLMLSGKKNLAYSIFYAALDEIKAKTETEGLEVFKKALHNVCPTVEVKRRRVGGATFQVPIEVRPNRKLSLGMKWTISAARTRNGRSMEEKLANELIAAANNEGNAIKKKNDTHRMAESNKAFSHFKF